MRERVVKLPPSAAPPSRANPVASNGRWASVTRVRAVAVKELLEILRQPRLLVTLVVGPFLILGLFGVGLRDEDPPLRTLFVAPGGGQLAQEAQRLAAQQPERLIVDGVTEDLDAALARLRTGRIDLVVALPADAERTIRGGSQAVVRLYHDQLDPVESLVVQLLAQTAAERINQQVLRGLVSDEQVAAGQLQERVSLVLDRVEAVQAAVAAGDLDRAQDELARLDDDAALLAATPLPLAQSFAAEGPAGVDGLSGVAPAEDDAATVFARLRALAADDAQPTLAEVETLLEDLRRLERALAVFRSLEPDVVVDPFRGVAERVTPGPVELTDYYAPAVLVLLVGHMVTTFVGLSLVRDEQLGTTDLLRVAPVRPGELLAGVYAAHVGLGAAVAAILGGLLTVGLGVPARGSVAVLAAAVFALLVASVGVGFVTALLARSDSQAVQYAMLVLLANVFLAGFLLTLSRFLPPLQALTALLPATHAILLLRDVMLQGNSDLLRLGVLAAMAVLLAALSGWLLRRRLRVR